MIDSKDVRSGISQLLSMHPLEETVKNGKLTIVIPRYDHVTGKDVSVFLSAEECEHLSTLFYELSISLKRQDR